jgi:hypothetical protein
LSHGGNPGVKWRVLQGICRELDRQLDALSVQEYGVSQVTMEEVFLKVRTPSKLSINRSPLSYSVNPGVNGVSDRGVHVQVGKSATEAAAGGTKASLQRVSSSGELAAPLRLNQMAPHEIFARHFTALTVGGQRTCTESCLRIYTASY